MSRAVLSPPNAILFVLDPTNDDVMVPGYVDGELAAATPTCVSFGTRADVDGDTEIVLELSPIVATELRQAFRGVIQTPGGKVAVVTSEFESVLEADFSSTSVEVSIWADDLRNPAHVTVALVPRVGDIK